MKPDATPQTSNPEPDPRLDTLLELWQPEAELSAGFEQRLHRRIAEAEAAPRLAWWRSWWGALSADVISGPWASPRAPLAGAVCSLAVVLAAGVLFHFSSPAVVHTPTAVAATAPLDPVLRDLQTLNNDNSAFASLDLLNGGGGNGGGETAQPQ